MDQDASSPRRLPVARSLFGVEALAALIASEYGLSGVRCQLIKATMRDTYLVTSRTGPYVFSIHPHGRRAAEEISAELDLLDHLASGSVPVAPAERGQTGQRLLPIAAPEGLRYAVLYRYVPGAHLDRQPAPELARRVGRAVARIHVRSDDVRPPLARPELDLVRMLEGTLETLVDVVPGREQDLSYLRRVADDLYPRLRALPRVSPAHGMVHGDVIPSNAQVTPDGAIVMLDFDLCGYGWRAYDIATFLGEMRFWNAPPGAGQAFLEGYEQVRPLAERERAALPMLEVTRHIVALGIPARHVNEWGSAYLTGGLLDRILATVRQAVADAG